MNKQLSTAYRKGYEARQRKVGLDACPYSDLRTIKGAVTFSRAFIKAWHEGYEQCRHDEYHGNYDGLREE